GYVYSALCIKRLHDMGWSGTTLAKPAVIAGVVGIVVYLLLQIGGHSQEHIGFGIIFGGAAAFVVAVVGYVSMVSWLLTARSVGGGFAPDYGPGNERDSGPGGELPERSKMSAGRDPVLSSPGLLPRSGVSIGSAASRPTFGRRHAV